MCVCLEKVFHERNLFKERYLKRYSISLLFVESGKASIAKLFDFFLSFIYLPNVNEDDSEGCNLEISTILQ